MNAHNGHHRPTSFWALSTAAFAARCLHVVSDLGVADHIGDQPVRIGELASSCGVDPDRRRAADHRHGQSIRRHDPGFESPKLRRFDTLGLSIQTFEAADSRATRQAKIGGRSHLPANG
jgi:hypothetical protein